MSKPKPTPEMIAADFAKAAPIGTPCLYFPVLPCNRAGEFKRTKIRSAPWVLGHGDVVVALDGMSGGQSIRHIAFES